MMNFKSKWILTVASLVALAAVVVIQPPLTSVLLWELADLLAIANIHLGNYFKIKRKSIGWALSALSVIYFIGRSLSIGLVSQCIGHSISLCLALYGFISWKGDESRKTVEEDVKSPEAPEFVFEAGIIFKRDKSEPMMGVELNQIVYHRHHTLDL